MCIREVVIICFIFVTEIASEYEVPDATLEVLSPRGLRISIPAEDGITLFAIHVNINKPMGHRETGEIARDITEITNGRWVYENRNIKLKPGDVLNYWTLVTYKGLWHMKDDLTWTVPGTPSEVPSTSTTATTARPQTCEPSVTTVNGNPSCKGQLIFEDNFNNFDNNKWSRDNLIPYGQDFEFAIYNNQEENCFIKDNMIHFKPLLTEKVYDKNFVDTGNLNINDCSGSTFAECEIKGVGFSILPPILAARIKSKKFFAFKYGKIEIRAKFPTGDWIYPEIRLEPKDKWYGKGYSSGEIWLALSRGNEHLTSVEGSEIGQNFLEAGLILGSKEIERHFVLRSDLHRGSGWNQDFHTYTVTWKSDGVSMSVDGEVFGIIREYPNGFQSIVENNSWKRGSKFAPFDREFYISIGLGVGGITVFPDNSTSNNYKKPWKNTGAKAMLNFWKARDRWYPTWSPNQSNLVIDYVKVWAV